MCETSIFEEQAKLRDHIETFLNELELPPLTDNEWDRIRHNYPKLYWKFLLKLISEVREGCQCCVEDAVMNGDLRDDLEKVLRTVDLAPLTDQEWLDILEVYSDHYWKLLSALIEEVRGEQHCRDVAAAVARERAKDEEFGQLSWNITRTHVKRFCHENDEVLSEKETQDLYQVLREFDENDLIAEAMDHMRSRS